MAKVEIYTWATCPFCVRVKKLLDRKGAEYTNYDISGDDEARAKMIERAGGATSVPQVFINDEHIGGCDDLHELDYDGKLNPLLKS